jgi:CRP-like cAMP-binding protein
MEMPLDTNRKWWDLLQAIVLFYLAISVPVRVGFGAQSMGVWYGIDTSIDLYFWIDIFLSFFFAYEDELGNIVYALRDIRLHYLKGWFPIDVIASIPVDLVERVQTDTVICSFHENCPIAGAAGGDGQLLRMVKLLRLLRLTKMLRLLRLQRILQRYEIALFDSMPYINLSKVIVVLLFLGHLFGSFFFFFSMEDWRTATEKSLIESGDISPWVESQFPQGVQHASLASKYITSMYWAFTTMTTVGYGDISAVTMVERTFAILGMIVGGFVFSTLIGNIAAMANSTDLSKKAHQDKMDLVGAYVRDHHFPSGLKFDVLRFFKDQEVRGYDEKSLINEMPFQIRRNVLVYGYSHLIEEGSFFKSFESETREHFMVEFLCLVHPISFYAGAGVINKGERGYEMYLLAEGTVQVVSHDGERIIEELPKGAIFGCGAVMGDPIRRLNLKAKTNCKAVALDVQNTQVLIRKFPQVKLLV